MEKTKVARRHEHGSSSARRPQSVHGPIFRHLPVVKEPHDYIWITQDILDEFKTRVLKSNKVTLKFSSLKCKNKSANFHKQKLPPLFAERLRMLHNKASTSLDLREVKRRPVKVMVDDITQYNNLKCVDNTLRNKGIKFTSRSSEFTLQRSMDSGGDDEPDIPAEDAIDSVAKANSVHIEHAHNVLPQIRAAQCPIHTKKDRGKAQEPIYSTNSHLKELRSARMQNPHPIKNITIQQHIPSQGHQQSYMRGTKMDINVKIPTEQYQAKKPSLPKNLPSKEFVMTWLMHGSAPSGSNHFPDIVSTQTHLKPKTKHTPRKSDFSE